MANSSLTTHSSNTPDTQIQGKTDIRQMTIAAMIARGFSVKYVAKKLKISESRIYHLLSDKNSLVNDEMNRILKEALAAGDRHLINLYDKVLQKLDAMLSSSDEEKQYRAMDRIIKMFFARTAKNAIILQPQQKEITMDDVLLFSQNAEKKILEMRKERGLDMPLVDKESSDSPSHDSPPEVPSPQVPSPDDSSLNASSPKSMENFVKLIGTI